MEDAARIERILNSVMERHNDYFVGSQSEIKDYVEIRSGKLFTIKCKNHLPQYIIDDIYRELKS